MRFILRTASAAALTIGAGTAQAQEAFDLGEIVVTATSEPIEAARSGASVSVLTGSDLDANGDVQLGEVLRRQAGVSLVQNGPAGTNAQLQIRGAQERFTAVYVDGIKVNDPSSTSGQYGNFGAFTTGGLTRVEILKGSQSALYGGSAVAGVVNIFTLPDETTPEGITQRAEVTGGSYGTFGASYSYVHKTDLWAVNFALAHARSDGFSAAEERAGNPEADGFEETRASFGFSYQVSDAVRLGLNGFRSRGKSDFDEFGAVPQDGTPGDEFGDRTETGLRAFAEIDAGGAWTHSFAASHYEVDRTQVSLTAAGFGTPFASSFTGERRRIEYRVTGQVMPDLKLSFGLDHEKESVTTTSIPGGTADLISNGGFAEALYSVAPDLDIIATYRLTDSSQFGTEGTGRLAFSWRQSDALTWRGAVATGFRPPVAGELFSSFPDPLYPFQGNPALQPETSRSVELGLDLRMPDNARFSATVFRNEVDDLIAFAACPVTIDFVFFSCDPGTFSTLANVPGTSVFQGLELTYERALSDAVDLALAYTFVRAEDSTGAQLPRTQEHELFLGLDVGITDRLEAQLGVTHVAGRGPDRAFGAAMPGYTVADMTFTYDVTDQAQAYLTVKNLFDEQYQQVAGYGTSDRAFYVGLRAQF